MMEKGMAYRLHGKTYFVTGSNSTVIIYDRFGLT